MAQKKFWKTNVEECLKTLEKDGIEIFRPEKSLFADKTKSVLEEFTKDPAMKKMVKVSKIVKPLTPFLVAMILVLFVVTAFEGISMWLPRLFGL